MKKNKLFFEAIASRVLQRIAEEKGKISQWRDSNPLSSGLVIKHKLSGLEYTLSDVIKGGENEDGAKVRLKSPDGTLFVVSQNDLEKDYEVA